MLCVPDIEVVIHGVLNLFDGGYVVDGVYGALAVEPVGFDGIEPWTCRGQLIRHDACAPMLSRPPVVSPHPVLQDLGDMEGCVVPDYHQPALSSASSSRAANG